MIFIHILKSFFDFDLSFFTGPALMAVFFLKLMQQSCINMFQLLLLLVLKPELRWKQIARAAQFFFLISKKTNLHVQHAFCLSLPLFCITTTLFCRTKTSNFLVTHYFYGGIVVCAYPIFCLLCSCSLLFFSAAYFHFAGR